MSKKSHFCNFKLDSGKICGKGFDTIYQLRLHRKAVQHQKKRSAPKTRGKSKTGQSYAARLIRSFSKAQQLPSRESDDESDKVTEAADQAKTQESDKDQEMDIDEAQMETQGSNQGDTEEAEVHGSINPHDTDKAETSGSDDAGAQTDSEVNPEDTGEQCTFKSL